MEKKVAVKLTRIINRAHTIDAERFGARRAPRDNFYNLTGHEEYYLVKMMLPYEFQRKTLCLTG